ncbi:GAF and ANTAR domain-containing protein [Streptomyces sp. NPDC020996]|uniref:GAF and ANTAR domain-containing protein n=1 Tax=Streptomyces sp. NPDC020996 TaxID=3154791 RepID=UPI00340CBB86
MGPRSEPPDSPGDAGRDRAPGVEAIAEWLRDTGPGEIPARLCNVAVSLLPVTSAGVTLHTDGLPVRLGASDAQAAYLEDVEATLGEGPGHAALEAGEAVLACDLATGTDARRWPVFAQKATAAGIRAMYSMPLGNETVCVGTLDLYRDTPGRLSDRDLHTARLMARVVTAALLIMPWGDDDGRDGVRWPAGLAREQDEVYQATGMVMAQLGVSAEEALARLRGHAFARDRTVVDVARDVVEHHLRFDHE